MRDREIVAAAAYRAVVRRAVEDAGSESTYSPGRTVLQCAADVAGGLLAGARDGSTNCETGAGSSTFRAVTVWLSGGGPSSDVTFMFDGDDDDPRDAYVTYSEGGHTSVVYLDRSQAGDVWLALSSDPVVPSCDVCGADSESVSWCAGCGNCVDHCDDFEDCDTTGGVSA